MPGAASQASVQALHRLLSPQRQNTSGPAAHDAPSAFSALLDTGDTPSEPSDRPEPPTPRESAPRPTGFVRNKPAPKSTTKSTNPNESPASAGNPARNNKAADDKAPAPDAKDTSETAKTDETSSSDTTVQADAALADATKTIADPATIPQAVAAVVQAPVAPAACEATGEEQTGDIAVAAPPAPAPVDEPLAADAAGKTQEADEAGKPKEQVAAAAQPEKAAAAKPAIHEQKDGEKSEKTQAPLHNTDQQKAAEHEDRTGSEKEDKPTGHAEAKDAAKEAKRNPDNDIRSDAARADAPRVEPTAPARSGAEQNPTLTPVNHQVSATQSAATIGLVPTTAGHPVPVEGLAVEIVAQSSAGKKSFDIRLDPPELGRINVRLDMDGNGHVTSHLIVDRAETLDLLRRDAPQLQQALEQAGLKTSENGLQFSLRDQSQNQNQNQNNPRAAHLVIADPEIQETAQRQYGRLSGLGSGLDIRV